MATYLNLVQATEDKLYGVAPFERPIEDLIITNPGTTATAEIELTTPALWRIHDVGELLTNTENLPDELLYLTEDHPTGATATWRRSFRGTTANGWSGSFYMRKNPLFPRSVLFQLIDEVLANDLWPHVWTRQTLHRRSEGSG